MLEIINEAAPFALLTLAAIVIINRLVAKHRRELESKDNIITEKNQSIEKLRDDLREKRDSLHTQSVLHNKQIAVIKERTGLALTALSNRGDVPTNVKLLLDTRTNATAVEILGVYAVELLDGEIK